MVIAPSFSDIHSGNAVKNGILPVVLPQDAVDRLLDLHGTDPYETPARIVEFAGLAMLVAATVASGLASSALRLPNAWMLGPLAMSIGLTASGHTWSALPPWLVVAGQVAIGASLGCRFTPAFFAQAPRFVAVVAGSTLLGIVASACFGWALARASGTPVATMVLGTAPGGVAEVALTAKTLQLGVPVVTAFHVTRAVAMMVALGSVYRLLARIRGWRA